MCRYTAVAAAAAACCRCSSLLCAGWQKLLLWFTASDPCVSSSSFKHDLVSTYPLAVPSHTQRRFLNLKKNMNVRFSQNKIRHRNRQNSIGVDRALEITGLKFALREKDWSFWKTGQDRWWSQLFYYCFFPARTIFVFFCGRWLIFYCTLSLYCAVLATASRSFWRVFLLALYF